MDCPVNSFAKNFAMDALSLIKKYDVAIPRYTSYPTVPYWKTEEEGAQKWMNHTVQALNRNGAISLYVHLPYCEKMCTYCGCNKHITKNHLVEKPYIEAVLKEWQMYLNAFEQTPEVVEIHLGGGTPTFFSPENLVHLIQGILEASAPVARRDMSFEAHPNSTSYEHLRALREIGFNRVSLGVQDFDARIMGIINRDQTEEEVEQVTHWARKLGYQSINYDLIYGLPLQNLENIKYNLRKVKELAPDRIAFYSYAHIPAVKPGQRAYNEDDLPSTEMKYALYQEAKRSFAELGYVDIGMDHFALPTDELAVSMLHNRLHRNFMGYTSHHTELNIGLGVSAISDSWDAYAQNEKVTARYIQSVNRGNLPPVFKNHFLTERDQMIRRKILNLICLLQCFWHPGVAIWSEKAHREFLELEDDGLLKIFPKQIKVTPRGQIFLRNICAVLDYRMKSTKLERPTFSKAV